MSASANNRHICIALISSAFAPLMAGLGGVALWRAQFPTTPHHPMPMLVAPMIGITDTCIYQDHVSPLVANETTSLDHHCTSSDGSAAALIESTLQELQPLRTGRYPLGYTLPVPLLQLFKPQGNDWVLDEERIQRLTRTIRDNPRPLILYLFSTHFSSHAPIEAFLAADPKNLATTQDGPIPTDSYYGSPIYNWNFSSTKTEITYRREQAMKAMLKSICNLPSRDINKINGVTILGELHHLFPKFESGMGFNSPYLITDYSQKSKTDFQSYLKSIFKDIKHLNRIIGSDYSSFAEISPPAKNIRQDKLSKYTEHIDPYAHGSFPISGWTFFPEMKKIHDTFIHIYFDGEFLAKTPINKGRQDVLKEKPNFGHENTGWRFDMNFKRTPYGVHRIDLFVEKNPGELMLLGSRNVSIMDPRQSTPRPVPISEIPQNVPMDPTIETYIDHPLEQESFYFNPLVIFWHEFREMQITRYIQHFEKIINNSCLSTTAHYTHQIIPFTNPSWDTNKFAIGNSLHPSSGLRLGVSLYGDTAYRSFEKWHRPALYPNGYGITEFHPLKPLSGPEIEKIFKNHENRGARFVSFFLEPLWEGDRVARAHNIFSFDPKNEEYGSKTLYMSIKEIMSKK